MATRTICFNDLPEDITYYYDRGPSDKRVTRAYSRTVGGKLRVPEYVVAWKTENSSAKDYWRKDKWGDWKLWKSSDPDGVHKAPD